MDRSLHATFQVVTEGCPHTLECGTHLGAIGGRTLEQQALYRGVNEATGDSGWLDESRRLADTMIEHFADEEDGAFFFSALHHDELILRSKGLSGGGNVPSANGIAVRALYRLADATGDDFYRETAQDAIESLSGMMWRSSFGNEDLLLAAAEHYLDGSAAASRRSTGIAADEPRSPEASRRQAASSDQRDRRQLAPDRSRPEQRDPVADLNQFDLTPDVRFEGHPVTIEGYASHRTVKPGETLFVAVALDIASGWHLYGENPEMEMLVPTRVSIGESATFEPRSAITPQPEINKDAFFDKELARYKGKIWYLFPIRAARDAESTQTTLKVEVRSQACDEKRCLPPRTDTLELAVTIDPDSTERGMRHRELFAALRLRR